MASGAGPLREGTFGSAVDTEDAGSGNYGLGKGCYPRAGLRMLNSAHRQKAGAFKDASYSWGHGTGPH